MDQLQGGPSPSTKLIRSYRPPLFAPLETLEINSRLSTTTFHGSGKLVLGLGPPLTCVHFATFPEVNRPPNEISEPAPQAPEIPGAAGPGTWDSAPQAREIGKVMYRQVGWSTVDKWAHISAGFAVFDYRGRRSKKIIKGTAKS